MKVQLVIEITLGRINPQPKKEFTKEDGKEMIAILKETIEERIKGLTANNAIVDNVKITQKRKLQTVQ